MHFSARDSSFFCKIWGQGHFLQSHFVRHKKKFMIFFVLMCFQDEVKQLSSWKFFDWNTFGNRFGNDVFELKNLMVM